MGEGTNTATIKRFRRGYNFAHYFKMRALKQISQWAIIGIVSIALLGTFAAADAFAQAGGSVDISGISTTIDSKSVDLDAGAMNFDSTPYDKYNGYVYSPGGDQDLELRGWVWDTNLGWISLFCQDGKNVSRDCGTKNYGVKIDLSTGQLSGWAWGDNIGWISFLCNSKFENEGLTCNDNGKFSKTYSSYLNLSVTNNLGHFSGYAWADSVGWFDLDGLNTLVLALVVQESGNETDWGVWTKGEITDDGLTNDEKDALPSKLPLANPSMPLADGNDGYDIFVHVADIGGNPISNLTPGITVTIKTSWIDSVQLNQTVSGVSDYSANNNGGITKPGVGSEELKYTPGNPTTGAIADSYYGVVTSMAPTDGGNCFDEDGDGHCGGADDWYYRDFGDNIEPQILQYLGAEVTITKAGPPIETVTLNIPVLSGDIMEYLPLIDIPTLNFILPGGEKANIIQATRNKADTFEIGGILNAPYGGTFNIDIDLLIDPVISGIYWQFIAALDATPIEGPAVDLFGKNVLPSGEYFAMPFAPGEALDEQIEGAMIRSTIELIDDGVKYYNNGLPRTADSVILNQVAQILSGNVFSPGAQDVSNVSDVPLFGDAAVYKLRTQILADVSELVRGTQIADGGNSDFIIDGATSSALLAEHSLKKDRVYYFDNHDVYLDDITALTDIQDTRPISIIVNGGDLYVKSNIEENVAIGLIVMESTSDSVEDTKGGHLYIHGDVTDLIDVSIFSDGPMFRYVDGSCYYTGLDGSGNSSLRTPNFAIDGGVWPCYEEPVSTLSNQFYLKGNVASQNCIGCSSSAEPIRGDNKSLGTPSADNYAVARLYDLNYFSNYRVDIINGGFTGTASTNAPGDYPVYFEYAPAPTDLLGFRVF